MTRAEIEAMIVDQFQGDTDKATTMGMSITNALKEIGQRHSFQALKEVETDVDLLTLNIGLTAAAWTVATLRITDDFSSYTWADGDMIAITGGTDVIVAWYTIASATATYITLEKSISSSDQTDVTASWIGTPQYVQLPDGVHKVHGAILIDGLSSYPIDIRYKKPVDNMYPDPASSMTSKPIVGYRMGDKLWLAPYTSIQGTVRLTTTSSPTLASGSTAEPTLDGVENALIARVLMDLYGGEEFSTSATYWENRYEKTLRMLIKDDTRQPGTRVKGQVFFGRAEPNSVDSVNDVKYGGRYV